MLFKDFCKILLESNFTNIAKQPINYYHREFSNPLDGILIEEIVYKSLKRLGFNCNWDSGSHRPGTDVEVVGFIKNKDVLFETSHDIKIKKPFGISLKSIKRGKNKQIQISGCRTTSAKTLEEKKIKLKEVDSMIDCYMLFEKEKNCAVYNYYIWAINPSYLNVDRFKWVPQGKNFVTADNNGVSMKIVHSMSEQLWISIDRKNLENNQDIKLIGEIKS